MTSLPPPTSPFPVYSNFKWQPPDEQKAVRANIPHVTHLTPVEGTTRTKAHAERNASPQDW